MPEGVISENLITGLNQEIPDLSDFTLYPVPVKDKMNIILPGTVREFNYRLMDVTGKVLKAGTHYLDGNNLELDLKDFKAGLYIFELNDNRQIFRKRFIKD